MVAGIGADAIEIAGHGADVRRDRHLVVVEDDEEGQIEDPRVVQGLEGHASRERAVANDRHDMPVGFGALGECDGHAQRGGNRRRGVSRAEGIMLALVSRQESRETVLLADGLESVAAPSKELVGVRLMPNVPDDAIARGIEDPVQRHGQLDGAKRCAEVPAVAGDDVDELVPDLGGECGELGEWQRLELCGGGDAVEQWGGAPLRHRRVIPLNRHHPAPRSAVRLTAGDRPSCRLACIAQG